MKQTLYIIRGLPGSGKSALARLIAEQTGAYTHEAEQFFVVSNGHTEKYKFDRRLLGAAHDECYGRVMRRLWQGHDAIVANTFSTQREVDRYLNGLQRCGLGKKVEVKIIKCVGALVAGRTQVPSKAIDKMRDRWEDVANETTFNGEL